jgi:hypothetical protein
MGECWAPSLKRDEVKESDWKEKSDRGDEVSQQLELK